MINLYRKSIFLALLSGFLFFSVNSAAQVSFSGGVAPVMCVGDLTYKTVSDIVFTETVVNDFSNIDGTMRVFRLGFSGASQFQYNTAATPTVTFTGTGGPAVTVTISAFTPTQLTIQMVESDNVNNANINVLRISGLQVRAITSAASVQFDRDFGGSLAIAGFAVNNPVTSSSLISNAPPSTANAGPDQTGSSAICGPSTTLNASSPAVGTGQWSFVSNPGGTGSISNINNRLSPFSGSLGTTYELQWSVTNGVCTPSTDNVFIHFDQNPSIAEAGPAQNVCGTLTTLNADAPIIGIGKWSFVSNPDGLGAIGNVNNRLSPFSGGAGSTYVLQWTVSNGVCISTDNISIHFDGIPTAANAGPSQQKCNNGSFTLAGNTPLTGTGSWSVVSGSAGITTPSSPISGVTGVAAGSSAVLRWSISNGVCAPSTSDVTLTNYASPSAADAGLASIIQCNNSTFAMNATAPLVGSGVWGVFSGSATITNPNSPNTTITGITTGNTATLRWTVSNGACPSNQDDIILTNDPLPTAANAGSAINQCNNGSFTLGGNTATVGTGLWSIVGAANGAVITTPASPTSGVTGLTAGNNVTLRWTITSGTCTPSTSDVVLTNYATPTVANAGPATLTQCNASTFTMSATPAAVGTGTWTIVSGAAVITNATSPTTTITGVTTTATLRWTVGNGVCATTQDDIILTNDPLPTAANAGSAINQCNNGSFTLGGNTATVGTGLWSIVGAANGAVITTPASPTSGVTGLTAGFNVTLRWTITSGTCTPSTSDVVLTNYATPTVANAGPATLTQCNASTFTMSATPAAVGTGTWTIVSGAAVITNATSPTTTITGVTTTATLRWTVGNGVCATTQDDIILTNDPLPTAANAGSAINQCNNGSFTLGGNTATVGTGLWSIVGAANGAVITTPASPTSGVTGLTAGFNVTLRWTITSGTCTPSTSDVVLTNYATPTVANAGPATLTQCNASTFTMSATPAAVGTGTWTIVSGAAVITNATSPTTTITGVTTTATLRWTVGNGVCATTQDDIILTNDPLPTAANAGSAINQCNNGSFTLGGNTATVGTGLWSIVGAANGAVITTPASPTSGVTGLTAGFNVTLRWTITSGTCTPSTSDVVLTNYATPTVANAGPATLTQCNASTFTMSATPAAVGTGTWTIVSGAAVITNATSPTTTITGVTTTATLRWTVGNGVCATTQDDIILTNDPLPTAANAGSAINQCNNGSFTLGGNTATVGTGLWSIVGAANGAVITTPASPTSGVTGLTAGNNVTLRWTITSGTCTPSTSDVVLTNYATPTVANAGPATLTQCNASTFTMSATPAAVGTGTWTIVSGAAVITNATSPTTTITGVTTTATLRWTVGNGVCATTQDDIILTNDPLPTAANAGSAINQCNNGSFTLGGNTATVGTGLWSIVGAANGAVITTPASPTSGVTGLTAGFNVTLRWTITSGTCTPSTSDVVLTNYATPTVANAGPATLTQCNASTFTMSATPAAVGTGTWTIVSGAAVITNATSPTTTITGVTTTATLRWTVGNGVCATTQDDIILTNDPLPTAANAGSAINQCNNGSFTLGGNTATVGTGLWSIVGAANGAVITTPASPTSGVTGLTAGNNVTLRWTITSGTCTPSTSDVVLTNYATPTVANAGPATLTQCNASTFTMSATPAAVGTGTWTIVSGAAVITNATSPTTTITGVTTTATLRWTVGNGVCATTQDDIILTNDPLPTAANAGSAINQCNNGSFTLGGNTATVGTGLWSIVGAANGAVITTPASPTSGVTGLTAGFNVTLRWTITSGTCTPSTSDVVLTNYATPTVANAGPATLTQCNASTFTMSATPAAVGTGTWTIVSGAAVITNATSPTTTITGVTTTATLRWTVGNGVCATTQDDIILTNDPLPTAANAGSAINQCNNGSFTLGGNTATVGTGLWSIVGAANGAVITTPASPTSGVTGLTAGFNVTLRWTITSGTCTPSTSDVVLTNYATPTVANAGPATLTQCNASTFTMSATPAAVGTGTWTIVSGAAVITNATSPTTTITGVTTTATLRWTVGNGVCATTQDDIILTNDPLPTAANAGSAINQCNNGSFTLGGNTATVGTGLWSIVGAANGAVITTPASPTSGVTGLTAGFNVTLRWTITSGTCTPSTSDVVLTNTLGPVVNAGSDANICEGATFNFNGQTTPASALNYSSVQWQSVGTTPTGTLYNATTLTPTYQPGVNETGILTFRLNVNGNGICTPVSDDMLITIVPKPVVEAGSDAQVCEGTPTFNFSTRSVIASTANGSRVWTHNGSGSFVDATQLSPIYNVSSSDAGNTIIFTLTVTSGSPTVCSIVQDQFQLHVNPKPIIIVPASYTSCEPAIINLSGTVQGSATSGSWSIVSGSAAGSLSVSSITGSGPYQVTAHYDSASEDVGNILTFRLTSNDPDGSGPCAVVSGDVNITINRAARVSAGPDSKVCEYNAVPLNGTVGGSATSGSWTGGIIAQFDNPTSPSTNYHLNASEVSANNLVYTFKLTSNDPSGICPAVSDDVVITIVDRIDPANIAIFGLNPLYAENDPQVTMIGLPSGGTFSGDAVSGNKFFPNIANLTPLTNSVSYSVVDNNSCVSTHTQIVIVNPITAINFAIEDGNEVNNVFHICSNTGDHKFIGLPDVNDPDAIAPTDFTSSTPGLVSFDGTNYFFKTDNLAAGSYFVTYTYTNSSPATSYLTKEVIVKSAPKSVIDLASICETSTATFTESSFVILPNPTGAVIEKWLWDYGDGDGSPLQNPTHDYTPGSYNVKLRVETDEGCSNESIKVIDVGSEPEMKFDWTDFCSGNYTNFKDQTIVTVGNIVTYSWNFGDGYTITGPAGGTIPPGTNGNSTTGIFDDPQHQYATADVEYDVTLSVQTDVGCIETLTRSAFILEYETLSPITGYFENFEAGNGSWFANRIEKLTPTDTSWVLGIPDGAIINTPAPGGNQVWWTGKNPNADNDFSTYYNNEKSAVIGPCHDLTELKRPMISFDYWSDSEAGSDGAVLQYSTNGGIDWETIGNDGGAGISWYNGRAITGNPGGQDIGQFGWTGEQASGWKTAHYSLSGIDKVLRSKVIFRIAFGSNNDNTTRLSPRNGFAFDNVYIGEKRRTVLVEYFTNAGINPVLNTYFDDLYDNQFVIQDSSDFFKIQYHIDRPSLDQLNQDNTADPAARSSFYGVTQAPSGIMDGILGDYYGKDFTVSNYFQINEEELDRRALETPLFELKIDTLAASSNTIKMNITVKYIHPTLAFSEPIAVYAALVEGNAGSPVQRNVLRKFLLGPGGVSLTNVTWTFNHVEVVPVESVIDVPIGVNNSDLHLVAFVQNQKTDPTQNRIHQAIIRKASTKSQANITGVDDPILAQIKDIAIYPNPATRYINFATEASLTRDYQYTIVDQRGITVLSGNLNRDLTIPQQVELSNIADGVYIVMIHQGNRRLIQRKLVVLKR